MDPGKFQKMWCKAFKVMCIEAIPLDGSSLVLIKFPLMSPRMEDTDGIFNDNFCIIYFC